MRMVSFFLALVLTLSCSLVGCGDSGDGGKEDGKGDKNDGVISPDDYTKNPGHTMSGMFGYELKPVQGLDLDGFNFNVLVPADSGWVVSRDFATEYSEAGSDVIQDAAFARVEKLKELYNVNVKSITTSSKVVTDADIDIGGQLGTYSLILCGVTEIGSLSLKNRLADLTEFADEEITLDAPWYNQNFVDNMTIGGRLFYVIGDFSIIDNEGISVLQYNLDLFDEYKLPNPYTMVYDGTWTMDALHELCKGRVSDFTGDGIVDQYDSFGFMTASSNIVFFMTSGAVKFADKDEDDLPYLSLNNSHSIEVLDKVLLLYGDKTSTVYYDEFNKDLNSSNEQHEYANKVFMENRALVRECSMYRVTQTRSMVSDFGILPIPKADVDQDQYYHMYSFSSPAVAIPAYLKKELSHAEAAAVLEALSYYGRSLLLYSYYETVLKGRVARDEDSRAMLDIIFDSSYFDIGICNNFGGIAYVFNNSSKYRVNTFASDFDAIKQKAESDIEEYVESWSEFLLNT